MAQAPAAMAPVKSPEILANGAVVFRLRAPEAAKVELFGNWPGLGRTTTVAMNRDTEGLWSVTVPDLPPEVWSYHFLVNGVPTLDPANMHLRRSAVRYQNQLLVPGERTRDYVINAVPHGSVSSVWYPSRTLGLTRRAFVYLPPGYEAGRQRYPVLYLLHGGSQDEEAWLIDGRAAQIFDNLLAAGKMAPMIVVIPNGNADQVASVSLVDPVTPPSIANQQSGFVSFTRSVVADLIPFVDGAFRTRADRGHRAIAGLSMGGAQVSYIALNHLELFTGIGIFSCGCAALPVEGMVRSAGVSPRIDPEKLAALFPALNASANSTVKLLYLSVGTQDAFKSMHDSLRTAIASKGVQMTDLELPGFDHDWPFWRVSLHDFVQRLSTTLRW